MTDIGAGKWLDKPNEFKLALFANCEEMIALCHRKVELMHELKRSLLHHWMKGEPIVVMVNCDEKAFLKIVRAYYGAIEKGLDRFFVEIDRQEHELLVAYAKYLIEYLEPQFIARSNHSTFGNEVERTLKTIRREHERRMKEKANG